MKRRFHPLVTTLAAVFALHQPLLAESPPAQAPEDQVQSLMAKWTEDAPHWKERMRAMVWCARSGPSVVGHLTNTLKQGTYQQRLFAAEALALIAGPKARQTLLSFLEREENGELLRVFADKTVHYLGYVRPTTVPVRRVMQKPKDGVRQLLAWAWQQEKHDGAFTSVRKQLANYDTTQLDSAAWCRPAPDVALRDLSRKTWRLSDFRGKKHVVLVFIDTQT